MAGTSKQLPVPYFTQPDDSTCQSTVLRMMASYIESEILCQSTGAVKPITDIKKEINSDPQRPDKKYKNSHANFKWWLEKHFPSLKFNYVTTRDAIQATKTIVASIDSGFPVLVSVSHARVDGHIILVVGYRNYVRNMSTGDFSWVVHDPYGQFDPSLMSGAYGKKRFTGGMSLVSGDELGPGRNAAIDPYSVSRQKIGDASRGQYYLLFPSR